MVRYFKLGREGMFKNYLKVALRNLMRHRMCSIINVLGLAVGMACCLLILVFVQYELSYDRFHKKGDQIYRVVYLVKNGSPPRIPATVAPLLNIDHPEIQTVRLLPGFQNPVHVNNQHFKDDIAFVDAPFFSIFTFPLIL